MQQPLKYFVLLCLSLFVGFYISYLYFKPQVDRTPPWHPFELNSNINLKSLVEEGYRCFAIPCGQAQFIKTIGDTMIQYDVSSIDCNTYEGNYDPSLFELEELNLDTTLLIEEDTLTKSEIILSDSAYYFADLEFWKKIHKENPYYPYEIDEIEDCYQGINWRIFQFYMKDIDSSWVVNYIKNNGGHIIENYQNWNSSDGGEFLVYHNDSDLYFRCWINKNESFTWDDTKNWDFTIVRTIPHLDQQRQNLEKSREEKQLRYHGEYE